MKRTFNLLALLLLPATAFAGEGAEVLSRPSH